MTTGIRLRGLTTKEEPVQEDGAAPDGGLWLGPQDAPGSDANLVGFNLAMGRSVPFQCRSTKAGRGAGQKPEVVLTGEGDKEEVELTRAARSVYKAEAQETRWRGTGPETRD